VPPDDRAIETNEAEPTWREPIRRHSPSRGAAMEPLVLVAQLLGRQAAGEVYRNSAGGITPAMGDGAR